MYTYRNCKSSKKQRVPFPFLQVDHEEQAQKAVEKLQVFCRAPRAPACVPCALCVITFQTNVMFPDVQENLIVKQMQTESNGEAELEAEGPGGIFFNSLYLLYYVGSPPPSPADFSLI